MCFFFRTGTLNLWFSPKFLCMYIGCTHIAHCVVDLWWKTLLTDHPMEDDSGEHCAHTLAS